MNNHNQPIYATAVPSEQAQTVPANFVEADAPPYYGTPSSALTCPVNEGSAREFLQGARWPAGLIDTCISNMKTKIPYRFIICDDSGSMITNDGHRFVTQSNGRPKSISCSRWSELTQSLRFHAQLARNSNAATEFRMLNGSPPILIGGDADDNNYHTLMAILDASPHGQTPLCRHIREVTVKIREMENHLRQNRQVACIVIATDGVSSDGDIINAMQPLKDLPVWVVIRLCTDDDKIVEYWNNIDSQVELNMDVLDDLSAEAVEVTTANKWLTYGEPLHKLREFGIPVKEIDVLDSMNLSLEQTHKLCQIIYGGNLNNGDIPHPEVDWQLFIEWVITQNKAVGKVWCPVSNKFKDWIDVKRLARIHGKGACTIS